MLRKAQLQGGIIGNVAGGTAVQGKRQLEYSFLRVRYAVLFLVSHLLSVPVLVLKDPSGQLNLLVV